MVGLGAVEPQPSPDGWPEPRDAPSEPGPATETGPEPLLLDHDTSQALGAPALPTAQKVDLRSPSEEGGNPLLDRVAMPIGGRTAATRKAVVIYPSERGFPDRPIARRARIVIDEHDVVLVDATGEERRRIPVGAHGVTSAAHISVSGNRPGRYDRRRAVTERAVAPSICSTPTIVRC